MAWWGIWSRYLSSAGRNGFMPYSEYYCKRNINSHSFLLFFTDVDNGYAKRISQAPALITKHNNSYMHSRRGVLCQRTRSPFFVLIRLRQWPSLIQLMLFFFKTHKHNEKKKKKRDKRKDGREKERQFLKMLQCTEWPQNLRNQEYRGQGGRKRKRRWWWAERQEGANHTSFRTPSHHPSFTP